MISETRMLYKLIVLYILNRMKEPIINNRITDFILEHEYTGYFDIQEVISDLQNDNYVTSEVIRNRTLYRITEEGRQALSLFSGDLSIAIRKDIDDYLNLHRCDIREETSYLSDYKKRKVGDYVVVLSVLENSIPIIELNVAVTTESEAEQICAKWRETSSDVYQKVMTSLLGK